MTLLLHRAGNVSSSNQAYKLQRTDADTSQQLTASHERLPAAVPAASPEAEADSSGHDAAPSNTTVTAGIIVASAAHVPQVSSKCVLESAVFPCQGLCYIGLSANSYIVSARHARASMLVQAPVRFYFCMCKLMSGGQCEDHVMGSEPNLAYEPFPRGALIRRH